MTDKQNNNEMIKYFKMRKGNNIFFIKIYCFLKIKMRLIKILIYMELMMNYHYYYELMKNKYKNKIIDNGSNYIIDEINKKI